MARPSKHDGVVYRRKDSNIWWMRYRDKSGCRRLESTHTGDWQEAQRQLRERLEARDNNTLHIVRKGEQITFHEWADFFLENYSKPPIRAAATHVANKAALRTLIPMFGAMRLVEIDASLIEAHLRKRLGQRRRVHRRAGVAELGLIKPTTVHQEFRVLRRIFSVAVKKKFCPANPCTAVEFPVRVNPARLKNRPKRWAELRVAIMQNIAAAMNMRTAEPGRAPIRAPRASTTAGSARSRGM
jgi:hypothetical protein